MTPSGCRRGSERGHGGHDTSGKDTTVINGSYIEDFCQWLELSDEEDCFGSDVGSSVDSSLCISEQDHLSY